MSNSRQRLLATLAVAVVVAAPPSGAAPVAAHEGDPRVETVVEAVEPALPPQVVVQVQAGLASQLVVRNPTATVLEVISTTGRPFLRISRAGVLADVADEEFFTTSNPNGAAPPGAGGSGPARWVRISAGDSWGWYDHRLHPTRARAPADEQRAAELGDFEIPLRYGAQAVAVRGAVRFRPLLGSFLVAADPAPAGLQVQALPGRLPGVFLSAQVPVTVLGRDGEPFLRFSAAGVEVNERSRTHVEDRQARGESAGPPSPTPVFRLVAPEATSYTWLDTRLRYPRDLPPEDVLRAGGPTVVETWQVPVQVAGRPAALTGSVTWVPEADAAARAGGAVPPRPSRSLRPYGLALAAVLGVLAAAVVLRRTRGAQPTG